MEAASAVWPWSRRPQTGSRPRDDEAAGLLHRAQSGDLTAFDALMRSHERAVLSTALRLLGCAEDAQDAAQEVFLRLFRFLGRVDASRPLAPWLYRVTVNVCRDLGRDRGKRQAAALEELAEPPATGPGSDPAAELDQAEEARALQADLAKLADKERAALVLRDVEGLSTEEVARALDSSPTTVRSQISRARLKLQRYRALRQGPARPGGVPS